MDILYIANPCNICLLHACCLAITVMFSQAVYSVDEDTGPAQPVLVLSNTSSTDTTLQVYNTNGSSATGEYCSILIIMV